MESRKGRLRDPVPCLVMRHLFPAGYTLPPQRNALFSWEGVTCYSGQADHFPVGGNAGGKATERVARAGLPLPAGELGQELGSARLLESLSVQMSSLHAD